MKKKIWNILFAACLTASLTVGAMPTEGLSVRAAGNMEEAVENGLVIKESEVHKLLTEDLELPTSVDGLEGATIAYSINGTPSGTETHGKAVVNGNTLKVTRPYAGEGDYKFNLAAKVTAGGATYTKNFPLIIREGLSEDSYAGYVYVCFSVPKGKNYDVQQIHFFLSEDGLNWTALNGCQPAFLTGEDYMDKIKRCGGASSNSVNFETDLDEEGKKATVTGDASVLFPFEGRDQGVRDPYLIRGCRKDGSDSNKVWLLATDLNTHSSHYNGNKVNNTIRDVRPADGNNTWELTSKVGVGSTSLFVWETEDWVHWTRRYIDVAGPDKIDAAMAWAPEAIYNPEKDNYLMYWSGRVAADGSARNRLYCCETKDFVNFGPTKLYEQEAFYQKYIRDDMKGASDNDGYGNIDTSQLWVADKDADGNITNPYGTLYRVVKDETRSDSDKGVLLGVQLMSADTVLDPKVKYDETEPVRITPYEYPEDGETYASVEDLTKLKPAFNTNALGKAEIIYNWFKNESVGNHFTKIDQKVLDKTTAEGGIVGKWEEGATMFKFIDRDEWCIMIDNYGDMNTRYEPFVTTDLSKPDSVEKMPDGTYGRTGGDVGTHGGMIPITVKEYNTLVETYNDQSKMTGLNAAAKSNYHEIKPITIDVRPMDALAEKLDAAVAGNEYSDGVKAQMKPIATKAKELAKRTDLTESTEMDKLKERGEKLLANKLVQIPQMYADTVTLSETELTLCTKAVEGLQAKETLEADLDVEDAPKTITWSSSNPGVAEVSNGTVTAKKAGTAVITATAVGGAKASCTVAVKGVPDKVTLKKKSVSLKCKKTFQIKASVPKDTVCSTFKYKSNKPKIASVSSDGKVTAKKKGTAKITVTAGTNSKAKATFTVKVK